MTAIDETDDGELVLDVTVSRVVFRDEDSGFTVARMEVGDPGGGWPGGGEARVVTAVGQLIEASEGLPLRIRGSWVDDPRYGRQVRIASYQLREPATLLGIERYLASGLVPGIGPELARRIVGHFGTDAFEVIEFSPERLSEIPGIGESRASALTAAIAGRRDTRDATVFLRGVGVPPATVAKIIKKYGPQAIEVVRGNPYRLCRDVWGIGFKTADEVALRVGITRDSPDRIDAGLLCALERSVDSGHMHLKDDQLVVIASGLLEAPREMVRPRIEPLARQGLLVREVLEHRGPCVMLPWAQEAEVDAAARVGAVLRSPSPPLALDLDEAIRAFEARAGVTLAVEQRRAVASAMTEKCTVITGGPGVGKTTIVRAIVQLAELAGRKIDLAAPTGRAARRLSEATGADAATLHRLLEFKPREGGFQRGPDNPLPCDVLVVDEASMVDAQLFDALVRAVRPDAQLVLVGDVDQLPSVGPGLVLSDVIDSGVVVVIRLTEIFRQAARSRIVTSAHQINRGEVPNLGDPGAEQEADFHFVEHDDPSGIQDIVVDLVSRWIPAEFGFDPRTDVQVLTPMHRTDLGTVALNRVLQDSVNPARDEAWIPRGDRSFRRGDKVMQTRNDYDRGVFNGDIGVVSQIDPSGGSLSVEFDNRAASYVRAELDQLAHAYAISIHKSQGSEYPAVVIPVTTMHYVMLQRSLLYTAITRGKKLVMLVGTPRAVEIAVRNVDASRRNTHLAMRLRREVLGARPARLSDARDASTDGPRLRSEAGR